MITKKHGLKFYEQKKIRIPASFLFYSQTMFTYELG